MKETDNNLISLLHISSIIFLVVSVIFGGFTIVDNLGIGMLLILLGVLGGLLLFAAAKIITLLQQNSAAFTYANEEALEQVAPAEEEEQETDQENEEEPENKIIKWYLTIDERRTVLSFYRSKGQHIEEIVETPFPKYCVVRAKNFVDVLKIKGDKLRILSKEEVNEFPELKSWIEDNIFARAKAVP